MLPEVYEMQAGLEAFHFWYVGRRRLLRGVLFGMPRGKWLDVGSSTGSMYGAFPRPPIGLDFYLPALKTARKKGWHKLVVARAESLPMASTSQLAEQPVSDGVQARNHLAGTGDQSAAWWFTSHRGQEVMPRFYIVLRVGQIR